MRERCARELAIALGLMLLVPAFAGRAAPVTAAGDLEGRVAGADDERNPAGSRLASVSPTSALPATTPRLDPEAAAARAVAAGRFYQDLQQMQFEILHAGARAKRARLEAARGKQAQPFVRRAGIRPPRELEEALGRVARERVTGGARRTSDEQALAPDVRVNDRYADVTPSSMQSEVTLAARGLDLVAAWNDGEFRFEAGPVGYATSRDGGRTWTDGGAPPIGGSVTRWVSDPVLAVDEKRGRFYLAGMAIVTWESGMSPGTPQLASAIAVARGTFGAAGFAWEPPVVVRATRDSLPDKPWIAADSSTGNVYVSYTTFWRRDRVQTDRIEFQRSTDGGWTWSAPLRLSSDADEGLVQGSRPALGPDGVLDVVWSAYDTTRSSGGLDHKRLRRSRDGGATFLPEVTVTSFYANLGSGAPGFDRGHAFDFPGIAVDRSDGPYRGRVYVVWQESLNFYDDYPDEYGAVSEDEDADATRFRIGETARGTMSGPGDVDRWRFWGVAGQTVLFYVDSLDAGLDLALRVLCADGRTRLAYNAPVWRGRARTIIVTLAETGDYFATLALHGRASGGYRVRTGFVRHRGERARDHRDVFVTWSDDAVRWSDPRRVNDEAPRFDDWLPEVAVSARGAAYVAWYDWRETRPEACGAWSRVRLARSDDGGESWRPLGALASAATAWTQVSSNIGPNQGDYIALFADHRAVRAAWADGRDGDPDVWSAAVDLAGEPAPIPGGAPPRIARVHPQPARRTVRVELALGRAGPVHGEVLDTSGRRRRTVAIDVAGAGLRSFDVDLGGLPAGVYFLRLTQLGESTVTRIALVP